MSYVRLSLLCDLLGLMAYTINYCGITVGAHAIRLTPRMVTSHPRIIRQSLFLVHSFNTDSLHMSSPPSSQSSFGTDFN